MWCTSELADLAIKAKPTTLTCTKLAFSVYSDAVQLLFADATEKVYKSNEHLMGSELGCTSPVDSWSMVLSK